MGIGAESPEGHFGSLDGAAGVAGGGVSGSAPIVVAAGVVSINPATPATPGSLSAADKTKLDGIPVGVSGRVTLGAPGTQIDITGLHGDTEGDYEFFGVFFFATAVGAPTILATPTAGDLGQAKSEIIQGQGVGVFAGNFGSLFVNQCVTTVPGTTLVFHARLRSKSGQGPRMFESSCYSTELGGQSQVQTTGVWNNTVLEITSWSFVTNIANCLLAGSYVAWRSLGFVA